MRDVVVAGSGMTQFGKFFDRGLRSLTTEAVREALADAQVAPSEVGTVFFGNAVGGWITGQEMIRGQVALRETGLMGKPIINVENACASGSSAVHLAWLAIASGQVDVALAVGAEKMTHADKSRTFQAIATAVDLEAAGTSPGDAESESADAVSSGDGTHSNFMDLYAATACAYMERSGATATDFAAVVVKSRRFASLNPRAQFRTATTTGEVLQARLIAPPLTLPMCSPIGDGAAAVVLCSEERARRLGVDLVKVRASAVVSGSDERPHSFERATKAAYEQAGVGPDDIEVIELHDAAAPAELMYYEELGLCAEGDGPKLLAAGETDLGGRVPVNPSGGLMSKGHPIGATGCAQLVELADQLRGRAGRRQRDGARLALAQNAGGSLGADGAVMVVTILERL